LHILLPPLSLYVHVPWCVRKCPYCDFNSHPRHDEIPEQAFVEALLCDLEQDLPDVGKRPLTSIFIGGGTPSLLSGDTVSRLLEEIGLRLPRSVDVEITLEANPGTAESESFHAFRAAGVNRLSLGVQSFDPRQLGALGRIHNSDEARNAVTMARNAGFTNLNLDLMFGLPEQTPAQALQDISTALALAPEHISYYQLTLEPNTLFYRQPPPLPGEDTLWEIQTQGQRLLAEAGYAQYEVSAYAGNAYPCRHNLNYWSFGDYLGIGPGAHAKLTRRNGTVERRWKKRRPMEYLTSLGSGHFMSGKRRLDKHDLIVEFMMNALRLRHGFPLALFESRTGLPAACLEPTLQRALDSGLIELGTHWIRPTNRGYAFLNDLVALFAVEL
jgi:oxygen-independent coproporphyrinogen-3 oxidase